MKELVRANIEVIWQLVLFFILLFSGWATPTDIVVIYAIETIVIGLFHALKMVFIGFSKGIGERFEIFGLTIFFLFHYGVFVFIQTTFFFVFLSTGDERIVDDFGLENFQTVLGFEGVQIAIVVLSVSLTIRLYRNFIRPRRYAIVDVKKYMFVPYLRVVIQQFVAILPGFFFIFLDGGFAAAIILILLRAAVEFVLNTIGKKPEMKAKVVDFLLKQGGKNEKAVEKEEIEDFIQLVLDE